VSCEANPGPLPQRRLIDAREVARLLGCSWRTVVRLADAARIPWGIKLGGLRRWDLKEVEDFIDGGCKPVRPRAR
jgi:excisionase family DNA binding protein